MSYPNYSRDAVLVMEAHRTGNYGDCDEESVVCQCAGCGDDIYKGEEVFRFDNDIVGKCCVNEYLYEEYAAEHREVAGNDDY